MKNWRHTYLPLMLLGSCLLAIASDPGVAQLARLKERVATLLTSGRAVEAERLLTDANHDPLLRTQQRHLSEMQELVRSINNKDELILSGYEDDIGKEVDIRLVRKVERWTIHRYYLRFIYVSRGSGRDRETARYRAGDLHYAEQMKLLARSGHRFAPHVRGLLAWQLGQRDLAREVLASTEDEWGQWLLDLIDRSESDDDSND